MALVTGGESGVGLLVSRELTMQGISKIVALSKSTEDTPAGLIEAQIIEAIQEIATYSHVRADISDASSLSDAYTFCNGGWMNNLRDLPPTQMHKDGPKQGADALDLTTCLVNFLNTLMEKGTVIDDRLANKLMYFRDAMNRTHKEAVERHGPRPNTVWLRQFENKLSELAVLVDKMRKQVSHELGLPSPDKIEESILSHSKEQPTGPKNETVLDSMEKEIALRRSSADACQEESSMTKRACLVCGKDAVSGRTRCSACSLQAECRNMGGAIRRAKMEAEQKAKRVAERKKREEEERLAKQKEDAEHRAKQEEERKAKELAEQASNEKA